MIYSGINTEALNELRSLEDTSGRLNPRQVVEQARSDTSSLHPFFEWDDNKAAEEHRVTQARHLIRQIKVTVSPSKNQTVQIRAYTSVRSDREDEDGSYRTSMSMFTDEELRTELLETALKELHSFKEKYAHIRELDSVMTAIRETKTKRNDPKQGDRLNPNRKENVETTSGRRRGVGLGVVRHGETRNGSAG